MDYYYLISVFLSIGEFYSYIRDTILHNALLNHVLQLISQFATELSRL